MKKILKAVFAVLLSVFILSAITACDDDEQYDDRDEAMEIEFADGTEDDLLDTDTEDIETEQDSSESTTEASSNGGYDKLYPLT